jgi:hypothetical protein
MIVSLLPKDGMQETLLAILDLTKKIIAPFYTLDRELQTHTASIKELSCNSTEASPNLLVEWFFGSAKRNRFSQAKDKFDKFATLNAVIDAWIVRLSAVEATFLETLPNIIDRITSFTETNLLVSHHISSYMQTLDRLHYDKPGENIYPYRMLNH